MIPLLSSADVQLTTSSSSFDCEDQHPHPRKQRQQHPAQFLPSRDSVVSTESSSTWTLSSHTNSTARTNSVIETLPDQSSSSSSNSSNTGIPRHHGGNRRRHSSVSFQETLDVLEIEKLQGSKDVVPEDIWYTKEELRQIRSQCKQRALESERTDGILERGLEHMVPRGSSRHSKCRRQSKEIVFLEQANEILEHGFLYHTEQLADEYRRASEASKRQARSRGCRDAVRAWGDLKERAVDDTLNGL
jgi:hypothetical protein